MQGSLVSPAGKLKIFPHFLMCWSCLFYELHVWCQPLFCWIWNSFSIRFEDFVFSSFLKFVSLRHSLLDSKITSSLSLCYDQATLNAIQRIILSTILMDDPSLQPLSCLQSELLFAIDSAHRSSRNLSSSERFCSGISDSQKLTKFEFEVTHDWFCVWISRLLFI